MGFLISLLEQLAIAILPGILATFLRTMKSNGIDAAALDYVQQSVASADANKLLTTPAAKLDWVTQDVTAHFKANWPSLSISFINSLIQLVVHDTHYK